jgi:hypothetical protein
MYVFTDKKHNKKDARFYFLIVNNDFSKMIVYDYYGETMYLDMKTREGWKTSKGEVKQDNYLQQFDKQDYFEVFEQCYWDFKWKKVTDVNMTDFKRLRYKLDLFAIEKGFLKETLIFK